MSRLSKLWKMLPLALCLYPRAVLAMVLAAVAAVWALGFSKAYIDPNLQHHEAILSIIVVGGTIVGIELRSKIAFLVTALLSILTLGTTFLAWFALDQRLDAPLAAAPLVLLVIASGLSVHVVVKFHQIRQTLPRILQNTEQAYQQIAISTYMSIAGPFWRICLATWIGIMSLATVDNPVARNMGLFLGLGLPTMFALSLVFAIPFMQATHAFVNSGIRFPKLQRRHHLRSLSDFAHQKPEATVAASLILLAVSILGASKIKFNITYDFEPVTYLMVQPALVSSLAVFLAIYLKFGSLKKAAVVMAPNVLPVVSIYGIVGLFGYHLNYAISALACAVLALAADNSIQFAQAFEEMVEAGIPWRKTVGKTFSSTGESMLLIMTVLAASLTIIGFARSQWIASIGGIMAATVFVCLLADMFLLPYLLQLYHQARASKLSYDFFYDALSPAERVGLKLASKEITYAPGDVVIEQDYTISDVFFMQSGTAEYCYSDRAEVITAPDCIGEFLTALGPISSYRVVAKTELKVICVSTEFVSSVAQENNHVRRMMDCLFRNRVHRINDPILNHNVALFRKRSLIASMCVQAGMYFMLSIVLHRILRVKIERPDGLKLSDIPGNIIVIANHHTEFDAVLTGLAVSDLGLAHPRRSPFFLANGRFWMANRALRTISTLGRLLIIRNGDRRNTQQEGFQYIRNYFKPFREATVFVFPWSRTPAGTINAYGKDALPWIVENLDCTIVPVCMLGVDNAPGRNLLRSIIKPVSWRIGLPVQTEDLRRSYGSGVAAEAVLARQLVLLSGGKLRLAPDRRKDLRTARKAG